MQNLEVELDAKFFFDLIQSKICPNAFYSSLLANCRSLLGKFPYSKVQHVYQEANRCADALARKGCAMQDDYVVFYSSPLLGSKDLGTNVFRTLMCNLGKP